MRLLFYQKTKINFNWYSSILYVCTIFPTFLNMHINQRVLRIFTTEKINWCFFLLIFRLYLSVCVSRSFFFDCGIFLIIFPLGMVNITMPFCVKCNFRIKMKNIYMSEFWCDRSICVCGCMCACTPSCASFIISRHVLPIVYFYHFHCCVHHFHICMSEQNWKKYCVFPNVWYEEMENGNAYTHYYYVLCPQPHFVANVREWVATEY